MCRPIPISTFEVYTCIPLGDPLIDVLYYCNDRNEAFILAFDELNRNLTNNFQMRFVKSRKVFKMQLHPAARQCTLC
jgi:hypothetical protein